MKCIFNRIVVVSAALLMMAVSSCETHEEMEQYLDVSATNLDGDWEQVTLNGNLLQDGTYFHISFKRGDQTYVSETNLTSVPGSMAVDEGEFKIYTDNNGAYIRGINNIRQEWDNTYYVRELTGNSMTWVARDTDISLVMTFRRLD